MGKVKWISLRNGWISLESIRFGQSRRRCSALRLQLWLPAQWIIKVELCKKNPKKQEKNKAEYFLRDTPQGHTIFGMHTWRHMHTHAHAHQHSVPPPPGWVSAGFLSGSVRSFDIYVTTAQSVSFPPLLLWRQVFCSTWCRARGRRRSHLRMSERSRESLQLSDIIMSRSAALQEEKSVCFYIHRDSEIMSGCVCAHKAHKTTTVVKQSFFYEMRFKGFIGERRKQEVKWWRFCSEIKSLKLELQTLVNITHWALRQIT